MKFNKGIQQRNSTKEFKEKFNFVTNIIILLILVFGAVGYSVGFHFPNEILPGQFADGNYSFNGSLGIGTNSPSVALDVNGNLTVAENIKVDGSIRTIGGDNVVIALGGTSGVVYTFPIIQNRMWKVEVTSRENVATAASFIVVADTNSNIINFKIGGGASSLVINPSTGTMKIKNENGCAGTCTAYNYVWSITRLN